MPEPLPTYRDRAEVVMRVVRQQAGYDPESDQWPHLTELIALTIEVAVLADRQQRLTTPARDA